MKQLIFAAIASLSASFSLAFELDGEELFSIEKEVPAKQAVIPPVDQVPAEDVTGKSAPLEQKTISTTSRPSRVQRTPEPKSPGGNLPIEFVQRDQRALLKTTSNTVLPGGNIKTKLKGVRTGDVLFARIPHSILAFPDENAPVVAQITEGPFKGARLLGSSKLEPNSKRIFIEFKAITTNGETYEFLANAVTIDGQTGFVGEHHSKEATYFAGDFASSFVAAYFDGLVPRSTNVFGTITEDYSPDSALKKGMASGAMASADRFREKLKKVPEFSELKGPIDIGLLIVNPGLQK